MAQDRPSWMDEEEKRADDQANKGQLTNASAPQLIRMKKEPKRKQKMFYIQPSYAIAFEDFVLKQKRSGGKKATELVEEMIYDLLKKYNEDVRDL